MAKRVLVLALVLLLIASLSAFGAKKPVEKKMLQSLDLDLQKQKMKPVDESIIYPYLTTPTPEFKFYFPMTDDTVGWTYYDYQDNSGAHRRIAKDYLGNLHFTWMNMVGPDLSENRYIDYNARYADGNWLNPGAGVHVTKPAGRGGYCGLDILPDSREVLAFHDMTGLGGVVLAIEKVTPGLGLFNLYDMPFDSIALHAKPEFLHWPQVGTAKGYKGDTVFIHITAFGTDNEAGYIRCFQDPNGPTGSQNMICQSPGKAAVTFPPNVSQPGKIPYFFPDDSTTVYIAAPVATSPTGSGHVAIAWFDQTTINGEMFYLESTTHGNDWMAGNNLTPIQITSWGPDWGDYYGSNVEIAPVYDYNNDLHIFFTAAATGSSGEDITLFHWSRSTDSTHKVTSRLVTANCGNYSNGISKPTAGVEYMGGDAAYNYLYVVYSGYRDDDVSLAEYANADIYMKVSGTGGRNWGPEENLTNTKTNGCAAGDCESEAWSTVAERVDSFMYVHYVYDLDASSAIQTVPQGAFTLNPIRYLKDPRRLVLEAAGNDFNPRIMNSPIRRATNGGTKNDTLTFANTGTATLYVKIDAPTATYVTAAPAQFSILQLSAPQIVNLTFSGAGLSNTILYDSFSVATNDGLLGGGEFYVDTQWVKFTFLVTNDSFYAEEFDTIDTGPGGIKMVISSAGKMGNGNDGAGVNGTYNGKDFMFDGSPALVTSYPGYNLGATQVYEHQDFLPEAHLQVTKVDTAGGSWFNIWGITTTVTKYAPMVQRISTPYQWFWWWWTVEDKNVFFENEKVIVKYTKLYRNPSPSWWRAVSEPAPLPTVYFGFGGDVDASGSGSFANIGVYDSGKNLVYLKGDSAGYFNDFAGIYFYYSARDAGTTHDTSLTPYAAGVLQSSKSIHMNSNDGYPDDTLYKYMSTPGWFLPTDTVVHWEGNIMVTARKVDNADTSTLITAKYAFVPSDVGLAGLYKPMCGNANRDGVVSVSDVVFLINYLFKGGAKPFMYYSNVNGDNKLSVSDVVYLINYLFKGGAKPICNYPIPLP